MSVIVTHAENKSDDYGQVLTVTVLRTHAIYIRPCPYAEDYPRDLIEGLAEWAKGAMS